MPRRKHESRGKNRSTGVIAASAVGFTLLVVLIVLNEILDLPHFLFNSPPTPINWAEIGMEVFLTLAIGGGTVFCLSIWASRRKRMEEALRQFKAISDRAQYGVGIITPDGNLTYVNESFAEMHGYAMEELIGKHYSLLHTEEQMKLVETLTGQVIQTGGYVTEEVWHRKKDGTVFPTWLAGTAIGDKGKPLCLSATAIDITERKRAEEALRESEERFRNIYQESPIGIELYDSDGKLLTVNRACLDIFGVSNIAEVQGFKLFEDPNITDGIKQRLRKGETVRYEVPFDFEKVKKHKLYNTTKSGIIHLTVLIVPLNMRGEKPLGGYLAQVQDITERKQAEEALRESERNFHNSLDSSPLGIRIVTAEGELLYANQAILDIYGYSNAEELKATPVKQRYTPESYAEHQERKESRKQGKPVPSSYEINIVRKNGEIRHLLVSRKAVLWGGEIQYQTLYQDITEHKRAEEALRQSEEFNSSLLTNSPNPILVINADTLIRYVNRALEKLTGFSSAELIGRKPPYPWCIEGNEEECRRKLTKTMRWERRRDEQLFRKKNGELFWVEITFKTVKVDGEAKYHLANWVDVTERKRLRENMQFYVSEITRAQEEERKRVAREIHDDSVQSLSALALELDAIAKDKERLPEGIIQSLEGLRAKADSILDGLRRFSHELRPGVIDQVGLVPALEILTEELSKETGINARLEIMGCERRLTAEIELLLFRIAQEALNNVRRHSRATKAAIKVRFTQKKVNLSVFDNGRGFEVPEMLGSLAAEGKLGIIGMQERTRLLDGRLLVKSQVGRGTAVLVEVGT